MVVISACLLTPASLHPSSVSLHIFLSLCPSVPDFSSSSLPVDQLSTSCAFLFLFSRALSFSALQGLSRSQHSISGSSLCFSHLGKDRKQAQTLRGFGSKVNQDFCFMKETFKKGEKQLLFSKQKSKLKEKR